MCVLSKEECFEGVSGSVLYCNKFLKHVFITYFNCYLICLNKYNKNIFKSKIVGYEKEKTIMKVSNV